MEAERPVDASTATSTITAAVISPAAIAPIPTPHRPDARNAITSNPSRAIASRTRRIAGGLARVVYVSACFGSEARSRRSECSIRGSFVLDPEWVVAIAVVAVDYGMVVVGSPAQRPGRVLLETGRLRRGFGADCSRFAVTDRASRTNVDGHVSPSAKRDHRRLGTAASAARIDALDGLVADAHAPATPVHAAAGWPRGLARGLVRDSHTGGVRLRA